MVESVDELVNRDSRTPGRPNLPVVTIPFPTASQNNDLEGCQFCEGPTIPVKVTRERWGKRLIVAVEECPTDYCPTCRIDQSTTSAAMVTLSAFADTLTKHGEITLARETLRERRNLQNARTNRNLK